MSVTDLMSAMPGTAVVVAILLLPGFLMVRLLGVMGGSDLWFAGSAILAFNMLLVMRVIGMPCHPINVLTGLAVATTSLLLLLACRRSDGRPFWFVQWPQLRRDWPWAIPIAIGCCAVGYRAIVDPLSGFDHQFRWDYLARYLFATGAWPGFPAATADDFMTYGWPDAMPPMAAVLNLICYLPWVAPSSAATAIRIVVEILVLMESVSGLARTIGGPKASLAAAALASTSAILLWAVAMGQETGLTAIGMTAMLRYLLSARTPADYIAAALAASLGALAREYGLAWPLLGLGIMASRGDLQRGWLPFTLTAAAVSGPWYALVWWHTGSPLWPHALGGLLPTNDVFSYVMSTVVASNAPWIATAGFLHSVAALLAGAGVTFAAALGGIWLARRRAGPLVAAILVCAGLWFTSIAQTAGGPFYALRVLAPAIAVAAAAGGSALAAVGGNLRVPVMVLVAIAAFDAGLRSWQLPINPFPSLADYRSGEWREQSLGNRLFWQRPEWEMLGAVCEGWTCLVDHPGVQAALVQRGHSATVVFNPACRDLFTSHIGLREGCMMLRQRRIGFVLLGGENARTREMCRDIGFFRQLTARVKPVRNVLGGDLYDIRDVL